MSLYRQIAFLANAIEPDVNLPLPYSLGDGVSLNRANEEDMILIRKELDRLFAGFSRDPTYYEINLNLQEQQEKHRYWIGEKEWRYFILEKTVDRFESFFYHDLLCCFYVGMGIISPLELGLIDSRVDDMMIIPGLGNYFYDFVGPWQNTGLLHLSEEKLIQSQELYDLFRNLKDKHQPIIANAVREFRYTPSTQNHKSIKLIELFSIIELLISHKPADNDSYGTIKKQLSNKLNLINNRMKNPLDFESYFQMDKLKGKAERSIVDKVVSSLYDYRSNVAHGSPSDFKEEFKALKDHNTVVMFLERELLPKLLQFSLREPQLLYDLKHC